MSVVRGRGSYFVEFGHGRPLCCFLLDKTLYSRSTSQANGWGK